jgi:predicted metalloendopeptidase
VSVRCAFLSLRQRVERGAADATGWSLAAMAFTESALGEALGKLYCARYFDDKCKAKALAIVESVRQALEARLKEVDWMLSDRTREAALLKMSRFKIKIGYPDEWIDYSTFRPAPGDSFVQMGIKSFAFEVGRENAEMNAPTDRSKWFMTPQTINAYYHPSLNEVVFPAAILQPPFFNPEADDAVNYVREQSVLVAQPPSVCHTAAVPLCHTPSAKPAAPPNGGVRRSRHIMMP